MRAILLCGAALAGAMMPGMAGADTLREALLRTYQTNPTLTGARARQRGVDENVAIARAQGRPNLLGTASESQTYNGLGSFNNGQRTFSLNANADYPFYSGGRVRNAIRAADARVLAGRADLRGTEGDLFAEAVAAYMDVIRDESIVQLNENQVRVLDTNLRASSDRFEVGDLTRTDVAQSQARLEVARSELLTAQGRLTASRENYRRLVGAPPQNLEPPPPLPRLPASPEQATGIALENNPDLIAANEAARASGLDVRVARAARMPTISATGGASYSNFLGSLGSGQIVNPGTGGGVGGGGGLPGGGTTFPIDNDFSQTRFGVAATIPLYQGGLVAAQVRQAQSTQSAALEQAIEVERFVIADTRASYASYLAAVETIRSSESAVAANRLALEGTRAEQTVGTRNVLDVLNAEQELLNSEVTLVTARRDAYVAGFTLLNAMGRAQLRDLGLEGGTLYDPVVNYERVARKASDWSSDPDPVTQATRTAETGTRPLPDAEPRRVPTETRPQQLLGPPVTPPR